jgi:hypothetical protein
MRAVGLSVVVSPTEGGEFCVCFLIAHA